MKKVALIIITIISVAFLILFFNYSKNFRYDIKTPSPGYAYKIDRRTGQTWLILGIEETLIKSPISSNKSFTYEDKAIELVKNSYALGLNSKVDSKIKSWLKDIKGNLKIYGWDAIKQDEQIYLVSYTFDEGSGIVGYYFEVNLLAEIVRSITDDSELEKKYGLKTSSN